MQLRRELESGSYEVVEHTITYEEPQSKVASITGRSGSKKFERSTLQKEIMERSPPESKRF